MNPYTPQFVSLFEGNPDAYGIYKFEGKVRADGKMKGHGITVKKQLTNAHWDAHLEGKEQLGIIPINNDNKVKFGAIDIDEYPATEASRATINSKIKKHKLPLIQFRSKSGGIHLFCFTSDYTDAAIMQDKLKQFAAFLGYGNSEIFPKQSAILKERGDVGQWINMPYFDFLKTERYAYDEDHKQLHVQDFVSYAFKRRITANQLEKFATIAKEALPDGPPCLQHLIQEGFPEGQRNNGLYNLGIYAKKAHGDHWRNEVEEYNKLYLKPPLPAAEVLTIIKSLANKDYNYSCSKQPICAFCNAGVCRTKKFGVGMSAGLPVMGSLTKLNSEPPLWFLEIEGAGRLELTTSQLQNPKEFQRRCLESHNIMPPILKQESWTQVVAELLNNITIVEIVKDLTPTGTMMQHLKDFLSSRRMEEDPECLLRGLVFFENGLHYFKLIDFMSYLDRKKFTAFTQSKVLSILRDHNILNKQFNPKRGLNVRVHIVDTSNMFPATSEIEHYTPPAQDGQIPF